MSGRPDVYLSHVKYTIGKPEDIAGLGEVQAAGALDRLRKEGLATYRRSEQPAWELAASAAEQTLAGTQRTAVDAVVYTTDSFWDGADQEIAASRALHSLGLPRTPLLGVGFAGCANLVLGLRTAAAYLRAGEIGSALLVTTDVCEPGKRLMGASTSVLSDGAASCLVGTEPVDEGFRLLGSALVIESGMHSLNVLTDTMAMVKGTVDGVRRVTQQLYASSRLGPEDLTYLVANNYSLTVLRIFAQVAGIPFDRLHVDNVADKGHCFAADGLINLSSLRSAGRLHPGERVLAIGSGHNSWGCLALAAT